MQNGVQTSAMNDQVNSRAISGIEFNELYEQLSAFLLNVQNGDYDDRLRTDFSSVMLVKLAELYNGAMKITEKRINESNEASMELTMGLSENFSILDQIAKGNFKVRAPEENKVELLGQLGKVINKTTVNIEQIVNELESSVVDFSEVLNITISGDLSARIKNEYSNQRIIKLKKLLNDLLSSFEEKMNESYNTSMELAMGLSEIFEILNQMANGNFHVKSNESFENELLSKLGQVTNKTIANLVDIIQKMKSSIAEISSSSTEIASTNEEISIKAAEEIKLTAEAASSVTELSSSIKEVANNTNNVYELTSKTLSKVTEGYKHISGTIDKTKNARSLIEQTATNLANLQKFARQIQDILKIINKISEKTDLLALNAAIEASGVGEAGRRFKVVAEEMRKLADNSMTSSKEIETVLTEIENGIDSAVSLMHENVMEMRSISDEVTKTGDIMKDTMTVFENTANLTKEVSTATYQQAESTKMFSDVVNHINIAANETIKGIKNTTIAIDKFLDISNTLREVSEKFQI